MLKIMFAFERIAALLIGVVVTSTMASASQRYRAEDFRNAVEGMMPLFQTNAPLFRAAVNEEKSRLKSKAGPSKDQCATTSLDYEEIVLLRDMSVDVNAWGESQLRVFSEMAIESLAAAGESSTVEMAILCLADIRRAIKSKVIPDYEFMTEISPQKADMSYVDAFNSRRAADSRQRAIRRADDDMCVALVINAADYVRRTNSVDCRNRFVRQLSEKNALSAKEMGAVAAGDWKPIFPLRH